MIFETVSKDLGTVPKFKDFVYFIDLYNRNYELKPILNKVW